MAEITGLTTEALNTFQQPVGSTPRAIHTRNAYLYVVRAMPDLFDRGIG